MYFIPGKAGFSVSHDPLEIIILCQFDPQETFLIINVENSCAA